ncbi:hypothetical protein [Clostridium sp.]|uniref:hypothetical protein n=1 Tax=Clostridium sp. TaxID=1506 RepID=UPI001D7205D8|nr:hypothetical protein [Clostridium sp.]MBS5307737.1 hypothetical protein [Clostridium sp.]MDU3410057.1 hypothetical protein [Clostridium sp.]
MKEEVLNSLKNIYDESCSYENGADIFNLLTNLAEKFNLSKEFVDYVVSKEF